MKQCPKRSAGVYCDCSCCNGGHCNKHRKGCHAKCTPKGR